MGAVVEIAQPLLPALSYEVTEFDSGRSWTWVAASPGLRTTAIHRLGVVNATSTLVEQTILHQGPFALPVALTFGRLISRYLAMKANGLRDRSEAEGVSA